MTAAMFSVVVDPSGDIGRFTITCERCGKDLPDAPGLDVIKVPNLDRMPPDLHNHIRERMHTTILEASRSVMRAILVDAKYEFGRLGGDIRQQMLTHARECGQMENT